MSTPRSGPGGKVGFAVYVGGGLGRTPMIAHKIREFLPEEDLLSYMEAILRVYNLEGRRDNMYKSRIKILVHETGPEVIRDKVEAEWERIRHGALALPPEEIRRIEAYFSPPDLADLDADSAKLGAARQSDAALDVWVDQNIVAHKRPGYALATISLKPIGGTPGDATADQMDVIADLVESYSHGEVRVSHEQNLILPHVAMDDLPEVFAVLQENGLATANAGLISDSICCPGLDYCNLANARSITIAQQISGAFQGDRPAAEYR